MFKKFHFDLEFLEKYKILSCWIQVKDVERRHSPIYISKIFTLCAGPKVVSYLFCKYEYITPFLVKKTITKKIMVSGN
jgi:hypothetical protein